MVNKTPIKPKQPKNVPEFVTTTDHLRRMQEEAIRQRKPIAAVALDRLPVVSAGYQPDGKRAPFKRRWRMINPQTGLHPNSQAALSMHRWDTTFGGPNAPKVRLCGRPRKDGSTCRAPAVRESLRCYRHGGRLAIEKRLHRTYRDYRPVKALLATALLRQLIRTDRVPLKLSQHQPAFREALNRAVHGVNVRNPRFALWTYGERRLHHEACALLALAFIAAWENIASNAGGADYGPWIECVRRATLLGLDGE